MRDIWPFNLSKRLLKHWRKKVISPSSRLLQVISVRELRGINSFWTNLLRNLSSNSMERSQESTRHMKVFSDKKLSRSMEMDILRIVQNTQLDQY